MDKQKLMEWLDVQARLQRELKENQFFDEKTEIYNIAVRDGVHLENAKLIVDALGIIYKSEEWKFDGSTATEISFIHNGIRFYGLENYKEKGEK